MTLRKLAIFLMLIPGLALAEARQIDEFQWEGVQRIVAVGDIHGDYDNYMATLEAAGLVDSKGKWSGGQTHFVQVGDLPDRGPDTRKIIGHISQLAKQAKRKGGRVHSLIGNHEVMNVTGDLRYVHPGEYEAFVTRKSKSMRDRYYEMYMERFEQRDPDAFAALPADFQAQWEKEHPLGWLEHRQAWDPAWNRDAEYAKWVMDKKVAIRINDNLFVHGGISSFYCANSLDSMTQKAVAQMQSFDLANPGIVMDPNGPLWYRGLSGMEPQASMETVDAILARQGVVRIVVGHQPTSGVIWPNLDARVVMIDTGISKHYGGHVAYLEILPGAVNAGYPWGKLGLPASDAEAIPYLEKVIEHDPQNAYLKARLKKLLNPVETAPADGAANPAAVEGAESAAQPICGTS
ncbi:MAG: metallophosphoesterase [Xanthomonadales bacterium]|nr:metallophosphoesterase [Xanthomonadales bacterium]